MTMCLLCTHPFSVYRSSQQNVGRTHGRPKKYALLCELRFEPSISYRCLSGNLSFPASASVRERSSPEGSGESLLNSGWITVGYRITMDTWNANLDSLR